MSLRWLEAITRYQGCGRVPAAFFIFGGQPGERHDAKRNGGRFGGWPRDRHQANVPDNVSQSFRARLVYDAARWMKRIFFVSIRTFFLMSQGDHRAADRPGKKFFGEEGGGGDAAFVRKRGPFPRPQENTDADGCVAVLPLFCRHKKKGSIAAPPKDDTWSKITLRRLPT